jgi:3-deoxy-manno-octulosonate cytidylyltransferase (CMP-KDO synthetase)
MNRAAGEVLIVIPARMAATRLPGKPLADIHGTPMVIHVWRRAMEADIGRVVVAAAEEEIAQAVRAGGGEVVLTDPDLPSGTDRVRAAAALADPDGACGVIVNLQGDQPAIRPDLLRASLDPLADGMDIGTIAAPITNPAECANPNVVKAVISLADGASRGRALYFSRSAAPHGEGPFFHHIGVYAFRREALEKFVALPPSPLERRERLEQLRALEAGMDIGVALVDTIPLCVDTPADLELVRMRMKAAS